MQKKIGWLSICLLCSLATFSQKKGEITSQDIALAKNLKKQFPDESIALESSEDFITFSLNSKEKKVEVNNESKESLINLDSRSDIQKYCFYDGESEITKFQIKSRNNKNVFTHINDEAYTSNDLFHNDVRVKYANISFPLLGYKLKTRISKEYHDIKYLTSLYFNDDYPIRKKIIKVEIPNWLDIELKEINFDGNDIKKNVITNSKTNSKIYTYTLEDVPAVFKEKNAPGPSYLYPHILVLAKSYNDDDTKENIFDSTQDLYNWYKSLVNSLDNDNSAFQEKVQSLISNAKSDTEKIKNIYYWVQDNIRYIAFEDGIAGFKPDEASNVFNKRYGDCKGMANLTKQMLIEAGFDARLTWIGTKRIAYDYSTPNLSVDNHMICSVIIDDKTMFLDGTEKFNALGEYSNRIQGKQVLIENGDNYILETVPESPYEFNKEIYTYNLELDNDIIKGSATKEFNGESRSSKLYSFDTLKNDKKDEFLEYYLNKGDSNISVSNIETSDLLNRDLSLKLSYDISIKNAISSFDKDTYINIDFDKELENFLLNERETDYLFSYKKHVESTTTLKIPAQYNISYLPENINISNEHFEISVNFSKANNIITYKKVFKIKNGKIETTHFETWNDLISKLGNTYNEQIVITKP